VELQQFACCFLVMESCICPQYSLMGSRRYYEEHNQVALDAWDEEIQSCKERCKVILCPIDCAVSAMNDADYKMKDGGPVSAIFNAVVLDSLMFTCVGCAVSQLIADMKSANTNGNNTA
jgi:hypothetical protein